MTQSSSGAELEQSAVIVQQCFSHPSGKVCSMRNSKNQKKSLGTQDRSDGRGLFLCLCVKKLF